MSLSITHLTPGAINYTVANNNFDAIKTAVDGIRQGTAITQTYTTATATVNPASTSSFSGIDNLQVGAVYAKVADLEQLRGDLLQAMQLINKLTDVLQAAGITT